jgi:flagellar biosynthesis anti-sigma factor FlgM
MGIGRINAQQGALPVESKADSLQSAKKRPEVQPAENADRVQFSDQTTDFLRIRKLADALPEVRQDRVDRLRKAIEQGTYNVSGQDIADAIMHEGQIDSSAL